MTLRTLEQAKKGLQELQNYVSLIEEYQPSNFIQKDIKIYLIHVSFAKSAAIFPNDITGSVTYHKTRIYTQNCK